MSRIGTGLIWLGGIALAALMAYTVALDLRGGGATNPRGDPLPGSTEIAVVYPERIYWDEFRQGILACADRGLVRLVAQGEDTLLVETPVQRRPIRFSYHEACGLRETRDAVRRLLGRAEPPVAVVGSSNTVLTVALAEAMQGTPGQDTGRGPVLLIPWATSVLVERPEAGAGPVALLDIDPGRTFRFCPNNQRQADLVARCLAEHDAGATVHRAYIVEDRHDPYSVDLADCFHRAIEQIAPRAELIAHADTIEYMGTAAPTDHPSAAEDALAEDIWRNARDAPPGETTWVVLPLQEQPAERLLTALVRSRSAIRAGSRSPLRVLCGDAMGLRALSRWVGMVPFPIWCVSFDALTDPGGGEKSTPNARVTPDEALATNVQLPAEIVSAVVQGLDKSRAGRPDAIALKDALVALKIAPGGPGALGRSIAFTRTGERRGDDLGHVLVVRPGEAKVQALTRDSSGRWNSTIPVRSLPLAEPVEAHR